MAGGSSPSLGKSIPNWGWSARLGGPARTRRGLAEGRHVRIQIRNIRLARVARVKSMTCLTRVKVSRPTTLGFTAYDRQFLWLGVLHSAVNHMAGVVMDGQTR